MNTKPIPFVSIQDLGLVPYQQAWDYQQAIHHQLIHQKRQLVSYDEYKNGNYRPSHRFILCEHPHVYTLGRGGNDKNLLIDEQQLHEKGIEFYRINRGGDITYHGPGQIVGYPIFDLDDFFTDIHKYIRSMEEAIIRTLSDFSIHAETIKGLTGVWLPEKDFLPRRKICAIGVHLSRWVTLHGFALNVNTNLAYFNNIIPCGITDDDKSVTTMAFELEKTIDINEVKAVLVHHFAHVFGFEYGYINEVI